MMTSIYRLVPASSLLGVVREGTEGLTLLYEMLKQKILFEFELVFHQRHRVALAGQANLKNQRVTKKFLILFLAILKKGEQEVLKKVSKKVVAALESIVTDGRARAMNTYN